MTLKVRIVLSLIPNRTKYLDHFMTVAYSPLNSAKLSTSSDVTLTFLKEGAFNLVTA